MSDSRAKRWAFTLRILYLGGMSPTERHKRFSFYLTRHICYYVPISTIHKE